MPQEARVSIEMVVDAQGMKAGHRLTCTEGRAMRWCDVRRIAKRTGGGKPTPAPRPKKED